MGLLIEAIWNDFKAALVNPAFDPFWQALHFAAGLFFPILGGFAGGCYAAHRPVNVALCIVLGFLAGAILIDVTWAVPKEYWFDPRYEGATIAGGWRDHQHYLLGTGVAVILFIGIILVVR